jgi:chromosome partitioning protein
MMSCCNVALIRLLHVGMKTVAIISQKGGVGKTTVALHLAVAAERDGKTTVIVDLDPQASAATWKDLREEAEPVVQPAQVNRLGFILDEAKKHGASLAIIDTSPNSESASLAAARAADLVLIPCRPHLLDLKAISSSIELARLAKKPFSVVLNAVPVRGALASEAIAAINTYDAPVAPVHLTMRAAYYHCLVNGQVAQEYEPTGKAAEEAFLFYKWVKKELGKQFT